MDHIKVYSQPKMGLRVHKHSNPHTPHIQRTRHHALIKFNWLTLKTFRLFIYIIYTFSLSFIRYREAAAVSMILNKYIIEANTHNNNRMNGSRIEKWRSSERKRIKKVSQVAGMCEILHEWKIDVIRSTKPFIYSILTAKE